MAKYTYEIQRIEDLKMVRGSMESFMLGAGLMAEIAETAAQEIERNGLTEGEIDELKVTATREGYYLVHANGAQDRIFAKVVKA